ncbi:protein kinase domain-containing protein [Ditylenchus destructor]|uniref:Protein kinase domain-containing protein n=1 Tax=Ditylenchus destructor TaxID=166010 RepID=A0AAD4NIR4_9BILA|nr:protein kinase domain-containing protein [Ditylenchus destructor]
MNLYATLLIMMSIAYKAGSREHSSPYSIYILNTFPMDLEGRRIRALREHNKSLHMAAYEEFSQVETRFNIGSFQTAEKHKTVLRRMAESGIYHNRALAYMLAPKSTQETVCKQQSPNSKRKMISRIHELNLPFEIPCIICGKSDDGPTFFYIMRNRDSLPGAEDAPDFVPAPVFLHNNLMQHTRDVGQIFAVERRIFHNGANDENWYSAQRRHGELLVNLGHPKSIYFNGMSVTCEPEAANKEEMSVTVNMDTLVHPGTILDLKSAISEKQSNVLSPFQAKTVNIFDKFLSFSRSNFAATMLDQGLRKIVDDFNGLLSSEPYSSTGIAIFSTLFQRNILGRVLETFLNSEFHYRGYQKGSQDVSGVSSSHPYGSLGQFIETQLCENDNPLKKDCKMSWPAKDTTMEPSLKRQKLAGNQDIRPGASSVANNGFHTGGFNSGSAGNSAGGPHFYYQQRPPLGNNKPGTAGTTGQSRGYPNQFKASQPSHPPQNYPGNQPVQQSHWQHQQSGFRQKWNSSSQRPYPEPHPPRSYQPPSHSQNTNIARQPPNIPNNNKVAYHHPGEAPAQPKPGPSQPPEGGSQGTARSGSITSSTASSQPTPENLLRITGTVSDDPKIKAMLEKSRITPKILSYMESFKFPYSHDVTNYEKLLKIGQGTFGEVFKARCRRTGQLVALKKILMENEKEGFPITALREIKMLQRLRHANITDLKAICSERTSRDRFVFYLVFSFCDHDLAGLLSSNQIKLKLVEIKTMMKHILEGLYKIHKSNILHRDMKAANVLIDHDGVLKLADFGLARLAIRTGPSTPCYTNRVVTLWYRPPELLLGTRNYGPAIDIWGAGCIMAELWTRSPILQGETEQKQLILISNLCGSINPTTWTDCDKLPYTNKMELPQNLPRRIRERLKNYLQNEQALSLVDSMLTLNPEQRPDASAALDHHFFFETPMPQDNIKDLLNRLPEGKQLFEYTAGCGAHANRGRAAQQAQHHHHGNRPMAPNVQPQHRPGMPYQQQSQQYRNRTMPGHKMGGPQGAMQQR